MLVNLIGHYKQKPQVSKYLSNKYTYLSQITADINFNIKQQKQSKNLFEIDIFNLEQKYHKDFNAIKNDKIEIKSY